MAPPQGGHTACTANDNAVSTLLYSTATTLQTRSEVQATLTTLLLDVENAATLSSELQSSANTETLQSQLQRTRNALEESRAVAQSEARRRIQLGDAFVAELLRLSAQITDLEQWRTDNQGRVVEYDELKRKLVEMTDRATALEMAAEMASEVERAAAERKMEEMVWQKEEKQGEQEDTSDVEEKDAKKDKALVGDKKEEDRVTGDSAAEDKDAAEDKEAIDSQEDLAAAAAAAAEGTEGSATSVPAPTTITDAVVKEEAKADDATAPSAPPPESDTTPATAAAPAADTSTTQDAFPTPAPPIVDEPPVFESVPERALMNIFAHLEAHDILSTAQVSIIMYSRVDILFGLGGATHAGASEEEEGGEATEAKRGEGAAGNADASPSPAATAAASTPASATAGSAAVPAGAGAAMAGGLGLAGGLFSQFGRGMAATTAAPAPAAQPEGNAAVGRGVGDPLFSAAVASAASSTATDGSAPASSDGSKGRAPMLTSEVANSMAEKLSPAELSVIISMRNQLRSSESDLSKIRNERDDLIAELKGVESVKDFLVVKLRDVERAQRLAESEKDKVARQVTSDQEVIAFLDYRVQELESSSEMADLARARAEEELQAARAKATEKVRVLGDMLRFERDQLAASEKEWKATKKVLVKEVKQCRAQIVGLEAERDGLREQNTRLREALMNGGKL